MSLISKIERLNQNLDQSNKSGALANEIFELKTIYNEFKSINDIFKNFFHTKKLFERYDLVINIDAEIVENLMENLNNIEINFNKNSSVDGIKKGSKNYSDYKNNIQTLNTKLHQDIKNSWEKFCKQSYAGDEFSFLFSNFNTHENEEILNKVKPLFEEFDHIKNNNEYNDELFKNVIKITKNLNEEVSKLKTDFSEDVKNFLNAIQNNEATLDLYTEDVIKWIKETNSFERYKITKNDN